MRHGRTFARTAASSVDSRRSERADLDLQRSPGRSGLLPTRGLSVLGLLGLVVLSAVAPACGPELDTSRVAVVRGSVGEEMFGVFCDRVGAQALREELTGESFRRVCHKPKSGSYDDKVDLTKLPPIGANARNEEGASVSVDKQRAARAVAIGRIEALARRRDDLVRALDATFPSTKIGIKDLDNPDEAKSCDTPKASGEGLLTDQIADMLGRMGELYNDGTLPESTRSLSRVVEAFEKSDEAQAAWARTSGRRGYRPIETELGALRPVVAYPHLRDLANASLRLLSADSVPYELDPKRDGDGNRIPVPGPGKLDAMGKIAQAPTLLQDLLSALAAPETAQLGIIFSRYANLKDEISYDPVNRLVFFDQKGDTQNPKPELFTADLQGEFMGTSVCPERIIDDPLPNALDASPDGKVRGLRNCPSGQWLQQRGPNTLFTWENFGFFDAIRPILSAFVKNGREDLFLELSNAVYKHWPGNEASADECRLIGNKPCPRRGMNGYEPLIVEAFATDAVPALVELAKALENLPIKRCDAIDQTTKACTKVTTVTGIEVAATATRALLDPDYAKTTLQLTDRKGSSATKRNDGTTVAQVTPAYLIVDALGAIDLAFDTYEQQNPNDTDRRANWRRARSQLVDQFMGVTGAKSTSAFANPTMTKMVPVMIDTLRAQLLAHSPTSFTPPYSKVHVGQRRAPEEGRGHARRSARVDGPRHAGGDPHRQGRPA